jgi:uncharacterized protein
MSIKKFLLPLAGGLATSALGAAAYASRQVNGPRKMTTGDQFTFTPWELQIPFESVEIVTDDGVTLRGWWLPHSESDHAVICCHGHRGAKQNLLGIGAGLWRVGNSVLLFDFRGCGDSDAAVQSLAYNEVTDGHAAVRFVHQLCPSAKIGILGFSMGGAVAILVAASNPDVEAVMADSSFADMRGVMSHAFRRKRLPPRPLVDLTDVINRRRYGYAFSAVRPIDVIGKIAPRPILLIHACDDDLTPLSHARRLFAAAGEPKELWTEDNAGHCGTYFVDRPGYVARAAEFFEKSLSRTVAS